MGTGFIDFQLICPASMGCELLHILLRYDLIPGTELEKESDIRAVSGWATTCSEYVTDTRYRPRTALDKLTIGVDSVSTAGLETQIEAARD
jgi:hypothetical protein